MTAGSSSDRRVAGAAVVTALLGIAISVYLTAVHYAGAPLVCTRSGFVNCDLVIASRYGTLGATGIPTAVAGVVWFAVSLGLGLARLARPGNRGLALSLAVWSVAGMAAVLCLVYAEVVILGAICLWCTAVHGLVLLTLLLAIYSLGSNRTAR